MNNLHFGFSGFFRIQAVKEDGSVREDTGWFQNLILDAGLDMVSYDPTSESYSAYPSRQYIRSCSVGSGSSVPAVTQVTLDNTVASAVMPTGDYSNGINGTERYAWHRCQYEFGQGAAAGNLSEVGIGQNSGALFSRSLIKDQNGDPTTITILADEFLRVFYELRIYQPTTDSITTVDGHTVTVRAMNVNSSSDGIGWGGGYTTNNGSYADWHGPSLALKFIDKFRTDYTGNSRYFSGDAALGPITGEPTASENVFDPSTDDGYCIAEPYVNGTYYRDYTYTFQPSQVNLTGGIGAMYTSLSPMCAFQVLFDPPIPKTSLDRAIITLRFSWGRYTPPV